jgi:cytochrome P450
MNADTFSSIAQFVPALVPGDLVRDFDIYDSPLLADDPQAGFKKLQQNTPPLFYTPRLGGHWVLLDPDLMEEALNDPARFSSRTLQLPRPASFPEPLIPAELDPPEHRKYRQLLNASFSQRNVLEMSAGLREAATRMIEEIRASGQCDFVTALSRRFPVEAFLRLYGLPLADAEQLLHWMHMAYHELSLQSRLAAVQSTHNYLDAVVEHRRANPGSDLVSVLLASEVDGRPIPSDMLRRMLYLVLVAGLDTVTETLAFSIRFLAQSPTHQKQLRENPGLISKAVEELLRRFGPIWMTRIAAADFTSGAQQIKKDDQFLIPMLIASAHIWLDENCGYSLTNGSSSFRTSG